MRCKYVLPHPAKRPTCPRFNIATFGNASTVIDVAQPLDCPATTVRPHGSRPPNGTRSRTSPLFCNDASHIAISSTLSPFITTAPQHRNTGAGRITITKHLHETSSATMIRRASASIGKQIQTRVAEQRKYPVGISCKTYTYGLFSNAELISMRQIGAE
jgi:hypothetical protein